MTTASQWPQEYLDYYSRFIKRLEITADLCQGGIDEIRNREYIKKTVQFLVMNATEMQIEVFSLEPFRLLEAKTRTEIARAAGENIQRSKRSPYWINELIGAKNNTGRPKVGLIEKLAERVLDMFSDSKLPDLLNSPVAIETALLIILNDTNNILRVIAKAPRPMVIPPVADRLITRIERFLGEVDRPPSEPTPEARDRKKKFPAKKPKHATKINKPRKAEAVTKNGGE